MSKRLTRGLHVIFILTYYLSFGLSTAHAVSLQSANYRFSESVIGGSGSSQSSSASYQTRDVIGDIGVGGASSANYQVKSGNVTTNDPTLTFAINSSAVNFGSFTASSATTTTATFSVSDYTSYGYIVQVVGSAPTNGAHTIPAMAVSGASTPGVEQFGINLVANTLPVSVGANPSNGQFGFGAASGNYGTANSYRYVSGETIALAPKSSGVTTYTVSYLVNVAGLTPGGQYTSDQTIIVTGTY